MNVFDIKQSLEEARKEGGSYILARKLGRVGGGESLLLMNYQESLLVDRTIGKRQNCTERSPSANITMHMQKA